MNLLEMLLVRSDSVCEICGSRTTLTAMEVPLPGSEVAVQHCAMLCETCRSQIENPEVVDNKHWFCLNQSIWSEVPAVKILAWRQLHRLLPESWAQDLLDQMYLDEDELQWARSGTDAAANGDVEVPTLDSNGAVLANGDSVTLIKDLDVKGANFTAKRGTLVKGISLTADPALIEGKVNGSLIVLKTCFLKKA